MSHGRSTFPNCLTRKVLIHHDKRESVNLKFLAPDDRQTQCCQTCTEPNTAALILEGSILVCQLRMGISVYINYYVDAVLGPYVVTRVSSSQQRIDAVFDTYKQVSLKTQCGLCSFRTAPTGSHQYKG